MAPPSLDVNVWLACVACLEIMPIGGLPCEHANGWVTWVACMGRLLHSTTPHHSTARQGTAPQHSTAQHSTAQHSTARHSWAPPSPHLFPTIVSKTSFGPFSLSSLSQSLMESKVSCMAQASYSKHGTPQIEQRRVYFHLVDQIKASALHPVMKTAWVCLHAVGGSVARINQ